MEEGDTTSFSQPPEAIERTIEANSVILSSTSEYFRAMLEKGCWTESINKVVEVELDSEKGELIMMGMVVHLQHHICIRLPFLAAIFHLIIILLLRHHHHHHLTFSHISFFACSDFTTLQLLMELSYGRIYTKHSWDAPTLPQDNLLHLIVVADMFEFNQCIEACCEELSRGLKTDTAVHIMNTLCHLDPPRQPISQLIDAAVVAMGPLEDLWKQGAFVPSPKVAVKSACITSIQVSQAQREGDAPHPCGIGDDFTHLLLWRGSGNRLCSGAHTALEE